MATTDAQHDVRSFLWRHLTSWFFWAALGVCLVIFIVLISLQVDLQWFWILAYAAIIVPFAPYVNTPSLFFRGGLDDKAASNGSLLLLASSAFISWVFAKSILNASTLSARFGIVGALGYACYYTSFLSAAFVCYFLRTRKGYRSLPEAINARYGSLATVAFGLAILFRLYQEVWSNAIVVAGFYGPVHSQEWWLAATTSTLIPLLYCYTGGMRASLVTDTIQSFGAIGFLIATLIVLGINKKADFGTWNGHGTCVVEGLSLQECAVAGNVPVLANGTLGDASRSVYSYTPAECDYPTIPDEATCTSVGGSWSVSECSLKTEPACEAAGGVWDARTMWSLRGGLDFLLVALLQGLLSYAFFDPVLTDRAFLAEPRTMVKAFLLGGAVAATFILLFGFYGIFGNSLAVLDPFSVAAADFQGMLGGQPPAVARFFGTAFFSIVNIIFLTSSLSTLDSTFASVAKLCGPEFLGILEDGRPRPPQSANRRHMALGRIAVIILPIVGILPLLAEPTALDATTISGTMVLGLGPPIFALIFLEGYRPLVFHIPFWWGVGVGTVYTLSTSSCCRDSIDLTSWAMGDGSYALLLGVNVIGSVVAWGAMGIALLENNAASPLRVDTTQGNAVLAPLKRVLNRWAVGSASSERTDEDDGVLDPKGLTVSPEDVDKSDLQGATEDLKV